MKMSVNETGSTSRREFLAGLAASAALASAPQMLAQATASPQTATPAPRRKRVLAIGDVHTAYQHDSVSHALATIEQIGNKTGLFETYIRTDTQLITKSPVYGIGKYGKGGERRSNAKNLNDFDAIFFYGLGEEDLSEDQKKDLLSFVHDDGKGYVGAHSAIDAFYNWPQYGEMMGAYFDNHPWGVFKAPSIVEERGFPGFKQFPPEFYLQDEIYVPTDKPYSRTNVDVLARLDASKIDLKVKDLHRTDGDFPVAWVRNYGKGNVFYSTFGHPIAVWDDERVQTMYLEAIKWALGLTAYTPRPHPMTAA
jgi:type 1 glutamine amidotransferase